jgi:hypothetical protein
MEKLMPKRSTYGVTLAELVSSQVSKMNEKQVSAFREELVKTLPAYIADTAERAIKTVDKQDGDKKR